MKNSEKMLNKILSIKKGAEMRPRGLLRYEHEIRNVVNNSLRRYAPTQNGLSEKLSVDGVELLTELGHDILDNENIQFQKYLHVVTGILY